MTPYPKSNRTLEGTQTAGRRWRIVKAVDSDEREREFRLYTPGWV
jgi:hypothetical protein